MALIKIPFVPNENPNDIPGLSFFKEIEKRTHVKIEAVSENNNAMTRDDKYYSFTIKFPATTRSDGETEVSGDPNPVKVDNVYSFNTGTKSVCFVDVEARLLILSIYDENKAPNDYSGGNSTDGYIQNIICPNRDGDGYINIIDKTQKMYNYLNISSSATLADHDTTFTLFPLYYYPQTMIVNRLYFIYSRLFIVGDVFTDVHNKVFHCLGGHFIYCNDNEEYKPKP